MTENGNYGLNASWTVWDGGANRKKHQGAKATKPNLGLGHTDHSQQHPGTDSPVVRANPLFKDALDVNKAMEETAKSQFGRGKEMYEQGQISKADLAQLEAQAASAQYDCVATQTQIDNYKRQLKNCWKSLTTVSSTSRYRNK